MRRSRFVWAGVLLAAGAPGCGSGHTPTPEQVQLQKKYTAVLVMYYQACKNNDGHPPAGLGDMDAALPDFREAYDAIKNGRLIVVWNTPISKDDAVNAATVLAFEKEAYAKGGLVQMVDAPTSRDMTADELKAALKKNPAWDPALVVETPKLAERPPQREGAGKPPPSAPTGAKDSPAVTSDAPVADRDMKFLGKMYLKYCQEHGLSPRDESDLGSAAQRPEEETAVQGVRDGAYVVVWRVDVLRAGDMGDAILAYEKDAPDKGGWVDTVAGEVKHLTPEQFKAATKAMREPQP